MNYICKIILIYHTIAKLKLVFYNYNCKVLPRDHVLKEDNLLWKRPYPLELLMLWQKMLAKDISGLILPKWKSWKMADGVPDKVVKTESGIRNTFIVLSCQTYLQKFKTVRRCDVASPPLSECFWALVGSFAGIGAVTYLSLLQGIPVLVASLGASACLIYGVPVAPFAQPRNAIAGHLLSAIIGVCIYQFAGAYWYTAALSVGVAVAVMVGTRTVHPPAGATALIAVITKQDWLFVVLPVGAGICIVVLIGLVVNNLAVRRQYPQYWW